MGLDNAIPQRPLGTAALIKLGRGRGALRGGCHRSKPILVGQPGQDTVYINKYRAQERGRNCGPPLAALLEGTGRRRELLTRRNQGSLIA